jgi:hypothetical protein
MRAPMLLQFAVLAAILITGCGEQPISESTLPSEPPPPATYRVTVHEVYGSSDPVAVMTFERDASGNPTRGSIVGKIHGWPFPHRDDGGDTGEGLFTYRTDFTVTRSARDQLPEAADGTRTVYFHPKRLPMSLEQTAALASGQPIIRDSVKLQFSFQSRDRAEVASTANQIWTRSFSWQGVTIQPPGEPPATQTATATYSPQYDGYVFR